MTDSFDSAENEINRLEKDNAMLLEKIAAYASSMKDASAQLEKMKKEQRRDRVTIESLKAENDRFKRKFALIENNPIGKFLLKIYRGLREFSYKLRS